MTNKEAIFILNNVEAYGLADVAKELAISALEKQIPKKPRFYSIDNWNYYCPTCNDLVGCHDIIMKWDNKFCKECGQKIDWGKE